MILDIARLLLFPALMAFAAASDLFTMTISNRVSLALAAGFLVLALAGGMGLHDILAHSAPAPPCWPSPSPALRWAGSAAATPRWRPARRSGSVSTIFCNYLLYASLFGGALTLLLLQFRQWPLPYPLNGQAWLLRLHDRQSGIPYGIALAIGALMVYPETEWIKAVDLDPPRHALIDARGNAPLRRFRSRLINHALTNSWSTPITAAEASRRNVESEAYEYRSHCRLDHRQRRWRHCRSSSPADLPRQAAPVAPPHAMQPKSRPADTAHSHFINLRASRHPRRPLRRRRPAQAMQK